MAKTKTPWGPATVVEEARVQQRAGEKRFSSSIQLLETDGGEPLLRISYATGGVTRRGPVTLRARDLDGLRASVAQQPTMRELLGWLGGDA